MVRFDLGPLFLGETGLPNLKVLITCLLLVLQVAMSRQPIGNHGLGIL